MSTTSKHLGTTTELTVLMPIRQGFVDARDTRTYAPRLRILLRTLHQLRVNAVERESVISSTAKTQ